MTRKLRAGPTGLHLYDDQNHLLLTGFYLPGASALAALDPLSGCPRPSRTPAVLDEEAIGQVLTRKAEDRLETRLRQGSRQAHLADFGMHTWVFHPSPAGSGRLHAWFAGEGSRSRYRVLVHRTPAHHAGQRLPLLWDEVYAHLNGRGDSAIRGLPVYPSALCSGAQALGEGLTAYRSSMEAVLTWADELGHEYTLII